MMRSPRLDPEVLALLEVMDARGGTPIQNMDPVDARAVRNEGLRLTAGERLDLARVEDVQIPSGRGDIAARVYAAETTGRKPALIYFHGGGFVVGNLETHDAVCRSLAAESGAVVVAVDYALAPEHRFPAAVEDAYAATVWVVENAVRLGLDAVRISVGGDSAGGTLAIVSAMRCRDAGGPALRSQVLFYPVTDLSSFDTGSYRSLSEGYGLTRAAMMWFGAQYLPSADFAVHPEASPLLASDFRGLPPALLITAEFDPLRDEGEAYARRLEEAGVAVKVSRYQGMIHGFVAMRGVVAGGRRAIGEAAGFLRSDAGVGGTCCG